MGRKESDNDKEQPTVRQKIEMVQKVIREKEMQIEFLEKWLRQLQEQLDD